VLFNLASPAIGRVGGREAFFRLAGAQVLTDGPLPHPRLIALLMLFGVVNFGLSTGLCCGGCGTRDPQVADCDLARALSSDCG
jgi:hypothetical protein